MKVWIRLCLDVVNYPLNKDKWGKSKHPRQTYTGKAATLSQYAENVEHYEKMFSMLPEILELSEIIQVGIAKKNVEKYHNASNSVGWIDTRTEVQLPILGKNSKSTLVAGLVKPVLSGFRSLVDPNELKWDRSFPKVKKVLAASLDELLDCIRNIGKDHDNKPNPMARSQSLWQECARIVDSNK